MTFKSAMLKVTCAIILKDEKVLITQRSEQMKHPLKWEFPGGKLNKNESEEDCILREIKEELNIEIRINKRLSPHFFDYGDVQISLIPFIADYAVLKIIGFHLPCIFKIKVKGVLFLLTFSFYLIPNSVVRKALVSG